LEIYKLRWGIEQLFSHLKKRGFDLGAMHMTDGSKLEKLFALVSLAFLISFGWGLHLRKIRKTNQAMRRKSLFRQGLEGILRLLNNPHLPGVRRQEFGDRLKSPFLAQILSCSVNLSSAPLSQVADKNRSRQKSAKNVKPLL